jgi:uncharacterized protein YkwD
VAACLVVSARSADDPPKGKADFVKEVKLLVDLTNAARAKEKLPALKANDVLHKAAMSYSAVQSKYPKKVRDMLFKHDLAIHELEGKNVNKRLDDVNYLWTECGENIAMGVKPDDFRRVFDSFMKSKVHRENILGSKYEEIGIGIVKHPEKAEWYITQIFATEFKKK